MNLGGGGAYNKAHVRYLKELLQDMEVVAQEEAGLSSDAKEAMAFMILGNKTYKRQYGDVLGATGAKEHGILGNIIPNPFSFHRKDV